MATLVALTYPTSDAAHQALRTLASLEKQKLIQIDDAIIASNEGDGVKLKQAMDVTRAGAVSGTFWGGLVGLLFLNPLAGMAIGAATGALSGKFTDYGIEDSFARELSAQVEPGKAVLLLLAHSDAPDRVAAEIRKHNLGLGGELLYTNLSTEDEQRIRAL